MYSYFKRLDFNFVPIAAVFRHVSLSKTVSKKGHPISLFSLPVSSWYSQLSSSRC